MPSCFAKRPCCHTACSPKVVLEVISACWISGYETACVREVKWERLVSLYQKYWKDLFIQITPWLVIHQLISLILEWKIETSFNPMPKYDMKYKNERNNWGQNSDLAGVLQLVFEHGIIADKRTWRIRLYKIAHKKPILLPWGTLTF